MILRLPHSGLLAMGFALVTLLVMGCRDANTGEIDASIIHIPGAGEGLTGPAVSWERDSIDLGIVAAGEVSRLEYRLTNSGNRPLTITQVLPSCGCTVARGWETGTIPPGSSSTIHLEFNAGDRIGDVAESATVVTNAVPSSSTLTFTARVMGPGSVVQP